MKVFWGIYKDTTNSWVSEDIHRKEEFMLWLRKIQRVSSLPPLHLQDSHVMGKISQDQTRLSPLSHIHLIMPWIISSKSGGKCWAGEWITWEKLLVEWCEGPRWPLARQAGPHAEKFWPSHIMIGMEGKGQDIYLQIWRPPICLISSGVVPTACWAKQSYTHTWILFSLYHSLPIYR